ncbi:MAG: aminodeoxychorismate synthase component I [Gemmataceae bacterium]|nr:aminodeoxychorismate synthase component I [Gemmataceae bacterium]MCS7270675.1 aminodeoxychorismate synthase component I [Gemmataceae bacterium]MDW8242993.1 aminodeoxychorismate synthase component I [Thermogemmata sp.]
MAGRLPRIRELPLTASAWEIAERLQGLPHLCFLDSAEGHPQRGRYSYVAAEPAEWLVGFVGPDSRANEQLWQRWQAAMRQQPLVHDWPEELPPFCGGWIALLGYGLQRLWENIPTPRWNDLPVPDLVVGRYDWLLAFDHARQRVWWIDWTESDQAWHKVHTLLRSEPPAKVSTIGTTSTGVPVPLQAPAYPLPGWPGVCSNFDRQGYEAAVARAVAYVHAGDCFQVNLSQRLMAPWTGSAWSLYKALRRCSPAPFAAYFDLGWCQVLSASPERFLRLFPDGRVETRPIKGTRPRGRTPQEDAALAEELQASPKERAENVMIVDLLRNDLGRVCRYGSVKVHAVCELESFRQVHHLVSEVRGRLRPGYGPLELLAAAFPGGSVTGAPKVRAMEIIAELEPTARGPYCGSLGWIGFNGAMDTNILIRTITLAHGWAQFPVGGGIVADSEPEREYAETLHKAAGLLRAWQQAYNTVH